MTSEKEMGKVNTRFHRVQSKYLRREEGADDGFGCRYFGMAVVTWEMNKWKVFVFIV